MGKDKLDATLARLIRNRREDPNKVRNEAVVVLREGKISIIVLLFPSQSRKEVKVFPLLPSNKRQDKRKDCFRERPH